MNQETQLTLDKYDVVIVRGTPRFRYERKLIARDKVPAEIQEYLINRAQDDTDKVKVVNAAPDPSTYTDEAPREIEGEDFPSENPYNEPEVELSRSPESPFTELEMELLEKVKGLEEQVASLSEDSEHKNISAYDLGEQLLNLFGIYTALAPRDPQIGDIHPFTLKPMNRYDTGLAYVERKKSLNVVPSKPVEHREPQANPISNGYQSFAERTAVSFGAESSSILKSHANDPIDDEATAEPNLRDTTIRPYW